MRWRSTVHPGGGQPWSSASGVADVAAPVHVAVRGQSDVERARRAARATASELGFRGIDIEAIVLATSELATNLVRYACEGELIVRAVADLTGSGLRIESRDAGPGIAD